MEPETSQLSVTKLTIATTKEVFINPFHLILRGDPKLGAVPADSCRVYRLWALKTTVFSACTRAKWTWVHSLTATPSYWPPYLTPAVGLREAS